MIALLRKLAFLSFGLLSGNAFAGSPGGLQLVILPTESGMPYMPEIARFFERYNPDDGKSDCNDTQLHLGSGVTRTKTKNISSPLALAAISDQKKRKQFTRALESYRDNDHESGFDGALVVDASGNVIKFYGISALMAVKIQHASIPIAKASDPNALSLAICMAVIQLPVMEAP